MSSKAISRGLPVSPSWPPGAGPAGCTRGSSESRPFPRARRLVSGVGDVHRKYPFRRGSFMGRNREPGSGLTARSSVWPEADIAALWPGNGRSRCSLGGLGALDVIAHQEFPRQLEVGLRTTGTRVVELPQALRDDSKGASARRTLRGITVVKRRSLKYSRRVSVTCWARFVRSSYIVRSTPSMITSGLNAARTRSSVEISSEIPSRAKYSACMVTISVLAAARTFSVSRSSAGGQSSRIRS